MNYDPCADAQIVLMIIASVVESRQQVVGFKEARGEAGVKVQVKASTEVTRKGCARIGGCGLRSLHKCSAGVRHAGQDLAEGMKRRMARR